MIYNFDSGYAGASACMILSSWGSAWGTWKAGMGVCSMGVDHPKGVIKNIVPIVMAGVLGIYGLIVSVIITQSISTPGADQYNTYSIYNGYTHVRNLECERRMKIGGPPILSLPKLTTRALLFCFPVGSSFFFKCKHTACGRFVLWFVLFGGWWYHWNDW